MGACARVVEVEITPTLGRIIEGSRLIAVPALLRGEVADDSDG